MTDFGHFNHWTLWSTLSLTAAFGFHYQDLRPSTPCWLHLHKPLTVDKYHAALGNFLLCTNLLQHVKQIMMHTPRQVAINALNWLDWICMKIMLQAKQDCSKLSKGEVPYSLMLGLLGKKVYVTKLILKKLSGPTHISLRCIDHLCKSVHHPCTWRQLLVADTHQAVQQACQEYQHFKGQGRVSWDTHLLSLLAKAQFEKDILRERHICCIISTERQQQYHCKIGWNYQQTQDGIF